MTFITEELGVLSSGNSSALALGGGATYNGTFENVLNYSMITVLVIINTGGGETATLNMILSTDAAGTNTRTKTVAVNGGGTGTAAHTLSVVSQYFRVQLVAGGTGANGAIQVLYHTRKSKPLTVTANETIADETDVQTSRSIITGRQRGGSYVNSDFDNEGHIEIAIHHPSDAFGDLKISQVTPIFQLQFVDNLLHPQKTEVFTSGMGSSVTATNGMAVMTNGANVGDYAVLRSLRYVPYRAGQGSLYRFTAVFDTPIANSIQRFGPANATNGFQFAYEGTVFGVNHKSHGVHEIRTLTVSASAAGAETATVTLNDVPTNVTLKNAGGSLQFTAYEIATKATYPGWLANQFGATVVFFNQNPAATGGGVFTLTSTGAAAGTFALTSGGTAVTDTFYPQTAWNIDVMDGTGGSTNPSGVLLNPQFGNVYQVVYQYLGFGAITFSVEASEGKLVPVHRIAYANTATIPSVNKPNMQMECTVASLGSAASLTASTGSFAGFTEGFVVFHDPIYSYTRNVSAGIPASTETNIFTLRNDLTFNSTVNLGLVQLSFFSIASDSAKPVIIRMYVNSTMIGADTTVDFTNFNKVNANSIMSVDTTAVTQTGGQQIFTVVLGKTDSQTFNLGAYDIEINKESTLTVTAFTTGAMNDISVSMTWVEEQ